MTLSSGGRIAEHLSIGLLAQAYSRERIREILSGTEAGRLVDVANFNTFEQTVIAGPKEALEAVRPGFDAAGVRAYILLNVSAPFHSRYMREPQNQFGSSVGEESLSACGQGAQAGAAVCGGRGVVVACHSRAASRV